MALPSPGRLRWCKYAKKAKFKKKSSTLLPHMLRKNWLHGNDVYEALLPNREIHGPRVIVLALGWGLYAHIVKMMSMKPSSKIVKFIAPRSGGQAPERANMAI